MPSSNSDSSGRAIAAAEESAPKTAIILIGHGSPRPTWRAPLDELAQDLGGAEAGIHLAFMEHCSPTLHEMARACVNQGVGQIMVLPLFISSGGHVNRDIVKQLEEVRLALPELVLEQLPAFGELTMIRQALGSFLTSLMAR